MPFAFLIIGGVFTVAAVRGNSAQLFSLLRSDLTGKDNYLYWALSILVLGALGYIDDLKPLSRGFLVLVLIVLVLANGGFFQLFNESLGKISQQNSTP